MANYLTSALQYHDWGYVVLPIDKNKQPVVWREIGYDSWRMNWEDQTEEFLTQLFSRDYHGIAIAIPNGSEVLDIDEKYNLHDKPLLDILADDLSDAGGDLDTFSLRVLTPSGGYHLFYRCNNTEGNRKLASRKPNKEELEKNPDLKRVVLYETRGYGGYVGAYPTPGYIIEKGSYERIPEIEIRYRRVLWNICKAYDEFKEEPNREVKKKDESRTSAWAEFNKNHDADEMLALLENNGWQKHHRGTGTDGKERIYLTRPGKNTRNGYSADILVSDCLFKVHSTSTQFDTDRAYTYFELWTILEFNNDFKGAAKHLYDKGYGDRYDDTPNYENVNWDKEMIEAKAASVLDRLKSKRITLSSPPEPLTPVMWYKHVDREVYNVCGKRHLVAVSGMSGTGKTRIVNAWLASALNKSHVCGWKVKVGSKKILVFDTEQEESKVHANLKIIYETAGVSETDQIEVYCLADYTKKERLEAIKAYIDMFDDDELGMIVIDGIVDLCMNFNDVEESGHLIEYLRKTMVQKNCIMVGVLHSTKTLGYMRGHLGTFFSEKADVEVRLTIGDYGIVSMLKVLKGRPFGRFPRMADPSPIQTDPRGRPVLAQNNFTPNYQGI